MKGIVKIYEEPHPRSCAMIASWPGIGNVSLIVASYLKDKLNAREIGEIDPINFFEPVGVMVKDNIIEKPHFPESKFYYWEDAKTKKGLIIFIGEEQPSAKGYELLSYVLDVARRFKVKRVYSCAAAVTRIHHSEDSKVWAVATKQEILKELKKHDVVLKGKLRIAGLNGLFLGMAKERDIEGVCLLGEVPPHAIQIANPGASYVVLGVLTEMLGINIELAELSDMARRAKEEMGEIVKLATAEFIDNFTEPIWEQDENDEEE